MSESNKENQSSLKHIDRNKSSLSVDDMIRNKSNVSIDLDRNNSSASRSPKKFNDNIININSMQIELDQLRNQNQALIIKIENEDL